MTICRIPLHSPEDYIEDHMNTVRLAVTAAHASQKAWLDATQGMDSYLDAGDDAARALGKMSGRFECAEGWRRHLHLGLSAADDDPLAAALPASLTTTRAHAIS